MKNPLLCLLLAWGIGAMSCRFKVGPITSQLTVTPYECSLHTNATLGSQV